MSQTEANDSCTNLVPWVVGLGLVGLGVRILHMDIPIRYDEAHTFMEYARHGAYHIVSTYEAPNNHVFHTLLVLGATTAFGPGPAAIRLPALLAGTALIFCAAVLASRSGGGRPAVLLATAMTAGVPILVEYSTNARGYTILCVVVALSVLVARELVRRDDLAAWGSLVVLSVVGVYTVPVAVLPLGGITGWLVLRRARGGIPGLLPIAVFVGTVVVFCLFVYAPILLESGPAALMGNRFVTHGGDGIDLADLARGMSAVSMHWTRGVHPTLAGLVTVGLLTEVFHPGGRRDPVQLVGVMLTVFVAFVLVRGTWGYERIWLWMLPVVIVSAAQGWSILISMVPERFHRPVTESMAASIVVWLAVHTSVTGVVRSSLETGGYPEGPEVAAWLRAHGAEDDPILTDFISVAPLAYYSEWGRSRPSPPVEDPARYLWVVLNGSEEQRIEHTLSLLRRNEIDPAVLRLAHSVGETRIYRVRLAG